MKSILLLKIPYMLYIIRFIHVINLIVESHNTKTNGIETMDQIWIFAKEFSLICRCPSNVSAPVWSQRGNSSLLLFLVYCLVCLCCCCFRTFRVSNQKGAPEETCIGPPESKALVSKCFAPLTWHKPNLNTQWYKHSCVESCLELQK